MGISQIVVNDFYQLFSKSPEAAKQRAVPLLSRIIIVVAAVGSIIPAFIMPHMLLAALFVFTFGIPMFVMMVTGLFWKRNSNVAFITLIVAIIASFIWEYSGLGVLLGTPGWFNSVYLTLVISVILGVGLTAVLPGKPGLLTKKRVAPPAESM